jgi:hypothetical protein
MGGDFGKTPGHGITPIHPELKKFYRTKHLEKIAMISTKAGRAIFSTVSQYERRNGIR